MAALENPMDRGVLVGYSPRGPRESDTAERLNTANNIIFSVN